MPATLPSERYLELIRRFPLRPIRSESENEEALRIAEELDFGGDLDPGVKDYLEVLAGLIEKFEETHYPRGAVSAAEMLRHLIESRDLTQSEVAAGAGIAESALSEMVSGKRKMGLKSI